MLKGTLTPSEVWAVGTSRLRREMDVEIPATVHFVDERDVEHRGQVAPQVIYRQNVFGLNDIERWRPFLDPPPTWLNLSFLRVSSSECVITLARSQDSVGRDLPTAINVSAGRHPVSIT